MTFRIFLNNFIFYLNISFGVLMLLMSMSVASFLFLIALNQIAIWIN